MTVNVVVTATEPLLSLVDAKAHLRVEGDDEDDLIQGYIDAAVQYCLEHCNRDLVPIGSELVFRQAALLIIGQWYRGREAVGETAQKEVPFAVRALISRHRLIRV